MRILFPTRIFYPSQTGGPANSVYFLAKELVKNNIEVFVITTTLGIKDLSLIEVNKWIKLDGVNVYYSDKYIYNLFPKNLLKLNIPKIDLIHFSSFFDQFNFYFYFLSKKRKLPYIISPRGQFLASALNIKMKKKKLLSSNFIIKKIARDAFYHVTSINEEQESNNFCKKKFNKKNQINKTIFNIPNLIDLNLSETKMKIKNSFCDGKYILYLGRISRIKNIELLIKVYSELNFNDSIKLIIAGDINDDIEYYKELRKLITELSLDKKVIFTERRIEGGEKEFLYKNAELFVLPSKSENFGMVVLESLIQKTPVVTTKGTPWESLNNRCGYWVEMNFNSIKEAIDNYFLLSNKEQSDMGLRGLELATEFSSDKLISKYIDMYKILLK